jgi:hypothetical protein
MRGRTCLQQVVSQRAADAAILQLHQPLLRLHTEAYLNTSGLGPLKANMAQTLMPAEQRPCRLGLCGVVASQGLAGGPCFLLAAGQVKAPTWMSVPFFTREASMLSSAISFTITAHLQRTSGSAASIKRRSTLQRPRCHAVRKSRLPVGSAATPVNSSCGLLAPEVLFVAQDVLQQRSFAAP